MTVVHNGIIENYQELRTELADAGHMFHTDTDTEVIAHLVEEMYAGDLVEAARAAMLGCAATLRSRSPIATIRTCWSAPAGSARWCRRRRQRDVHGLGDPGLYVARHAASSTSWTARS